MRELSPNRIKTQGTRGQAFTLIELLVVIAIIALLIGILLPALGQARLTARKLKSSVQLRTIHQALVQHAADNDGHYTGYDSIRREWIADWKQYDLLNGPTNGTMPNGTMPEVRFAELIRLDLIVPETLIHPADPDPKDPWSFAAGDFTYEHYSYAVNELGWDRDDPDYDEAKKAWRDTMDSRTPVASDRLYRLIGGFSNQWRHENYIGMYSQRPGDIQIGVVWNDGRVDFSTSPVVTNTSIGKIRNTRDNIFSRGDDLQEGNQQSGNPRNPAEGSSIKMNTLGWDSWQPGGDE